MIRSLQSHSKYLAIFIKAAFFIGVLYAFSYYAWLGDDGLITLRVVKNFFNGHGLRWNLDERVQVYTHPLWMFLEMPFYYLSGGNPYKTSYFLSLICSAAAIFLVMYRRPANTVNTVILLLLPLAASKLMRDFSNSGLEVPLIWLILAVFYNTYLFQPHKTVKLYCIAALGMLTRMDMILLMAPALFHLWCSDRAKIAHIRKAFIGGLPILGWMVFSFIYYGFVFPNTKYAKMVEGVPFEDKVVQGLWYLHYFFAFDMFGATLMVAGLWVGLTCLPWRVQDRRYNPYLFMAAGAMLYCLYTICVGGDFMAGRFFAGPLWIVLMLLYHHAELIKPLHKLIVLVAAVTIPFLQPNWLDSIAANDVKKYKGVFNERLYFERFSTTFYEGGFRKLEPENPQLTMLLTGIPKEIRYDEKTGNKYTFVASVGFRGFYLPEDVIHIDQLGIADPLIARMPADPYRSMRPGHVLRLMNDHDYIRARARRDPSEMPMNLRIYYSHLWNIVHLPIWDPWRWRSLIQFHMGEFDQYRDKYVDQYVKDNGIQLPR